MEIAFRCTIFEWSPAKLCDANGNDDVQEVWSSEWRLVSSFTLSCLFRLTLEHNKPRGSNRKVIKIADQCADSVPNPMKISKQASAFRLARPALSYLYRAGYPEGVSREKRKGICKKGHKGDDEQRGEPVEMYRGWRCSSMPFKSGLINLLVLFNFDGRGWGASFCESNGRLERGRKLYYRLLLE